MLQRHFCRHVPDVLWVDHDSPSRFVYCKRCASSACSQSLVMGCSNVSLNKVSNQLFAIIVRSNQAGAESSYCFRPLSRKQLTETMCDCRNQGPSSSLYRLEIYIIIISCYNRYLESHLYLTEKSCFRYVVL
jgi:hypothetical protein